MTLAERAKRRLAETLAAQEAEERRSHEQRLARQRHEALEALYEYLPLLLDTDPGSVEIVNIELKDGMLLPCVEVEPDVWLTGDTFYRPGHERLFLHFGRPTISPEEARSNNTAVSAVWYYPWHQVRSLTELGGLLDWAGCWKGARNERH